MGFGLETSYSISAAVTCKPSTMERQTQTELCVPKWRMFLYCLTGDDEFRLGIWIYTSIIVIKVQIIIQELLLCIYIHLKNVLDDVVNVKHRVDVADMVKELKDI